MNERIKKLRKSLGLTQQEFADNLHIKRGAIANYEIGRNEPTESVIALICRVYRVREAWLRYGEGEMLEPHQGDAVDKIADEYGVTDYGKDLIRLVLNLPYDAQEAIVRTLKDMNGSETFPAKKPSPLGKVAEAKPLRLSNNPDFR